MTKRELKRRCMIETAINFATEGIDYAIDTPLFEKAYMDLYDGIKYRYIPNSWSHKMFMESVENVLHEEHDKKFIFRGRRVGTGAAVGAGIGASLTALKIWEQETILKMDRKECGGDKECIRKIDEKLAALRKKRLTLGLAGTAGGALVGGGVGQLIHTMNKKDVSKKLIQKGWSPDYVKAFTDKAYGKWLTPKDGRKYYDDVYNVAYDSSRN